MNINEDNLKLTPAANVTVKKVCWLWEPYIPAGKVSLLQGDPGTGKSTFVMNLAAILTSGDPFPFEDERREPVSVIYQTTEDDAEDTVVPRFLQAGGDANRLFFICEDEKPLSFADERLRMAILRTGAKLLVLDPLTFYIGSVVSMNSANEVRAKFNPLIQVARDTGCAILVVAHMNKREDTKALYRAVGSIDVVGAIRSGLLIAAPEGDRSPKRVLAVTKSNLAEKGMSIVFNIGKKVKWLEQLDSSADEALGIPFSPASRPDLKIQQAMALLADLLSDGPKFATEIMSEVEKAGISERTANTAKKQLSIQSRIEKQAVGCGNCRRLRQGCNNSYTLRIATLIRSLAPMRRKLDGSKSVRFVLGTA